MRNTCGAGALSVTSRTDHRLDPAAADLLRRVIETPRGRVTADALADHGRAGVLLQSLRLIEPDGFETTTVSLTEHDDTPVTITRSADQAGYGYFSSSAGWVTVPSDRLGLFRVNFGKLFELVLQRLDLPAHATPTQLLPEILWEIGDARIGRRRQRVPIWFARRLSDRAVWAQVADAARRRPTTQMRILLTCTAASQLPEATLPGHVIVSVSDASEAGTGLKINPDILDASIDGPQPSDIHERVHLSASGQQLVINGNVTINFKSEIQIAIARKLAQGFKDGKRFSARELLDHSQSSAKTLRQAFGSQRWAELEIYLKSQNGIWGFEP